MRGDRGGRAGVRVTDRDARSPLLGTGMLGAPRYGQGCSDPPVTDRNAGSRRGSSDSSNAGSCLGWENETCSFFSFAPSHRGLRPGGVRGVSLGNPPEQLCAPGMLLQGAGTPQCWHVLSCRAPLQCSGGCQSRVFHLPPLNWGFAVTPGRAYWLCPTVLDGILLPGTLEAPAGVQKISSFPCPTAASAVAQAGMTAATR